jgi:hypothetical protein
MTDYQPDRPGACRGDIIPDDGTAAGLVGWPLPCPCTEAVPARVRGWTVQT